MPRRMVLLALFFTASCASTPNTSPHAPPLVPTTAPIRRTLVARRPAHEPGWETRLYLIEYAPLAAAPVHVHPAVGVGWVIAGSFESAFGDAPASVTHAGEGFVDLADVPHRLFRNPSPSEELRFVVAYTMRVEDEPFYSR